MRHLILYDFAVHWLDMTRLFFGDQKLEEISATDAFAPGQEIGVPMMASVLAGFERGSAVLDFVIVILSLSTISDYDYDYD